MKEGWFLIDVAAATQHVLSKLKISIEKKRNFCNECITFVLNMLFKLQEHLPTRYTKVRNVSAVSPVNMAEENRFVSRRFLCLANDLDSLKFIASSMAENTKFQFDEFVKNEVPKNRNKFLEFDMRKEYVDGFLSAHSGTCPEYKDFWSFCKLVFHSFTWSEFHWKRI